MRGIVVFVHGGYWRAFDKSSWSHLAAGANGRGYAVVIPSYTLCPQAQITEITGQVARAINQAAGMLSGPVYLAGHSAGGHLVSRMVCATSALSRGVADRVEQVLSISGVHDLRPLMRTAMNRDLRLDFDEATRESPVLHYPRDGVRHHAWVGAGERPEFIRQSELIANIWSGCGADTALTIEPGKHHFDVIDSLADPKSAMLDALLGED
jgi:arylformamidase